MAFFDWLFNSSKKSEQKPVERKSSTPFFSTHALERGESFVGVNDILNEAIRALPTGTPAGALDDSTGIATAKIQANGTTTLSDALLMWYASQGFIGYQLCAILAQHWLINKACAMPARDAVRNGYNIVSIDGDDLEDDAIKLLKKYDRKFQINKHLQEFLRFGRIFGIRIAMFKVDSTDAQYYEKPFNIDGVTPNSYKGIVQLDPYWCAPWLDLAGASQPDLLHFYDPSHWIINGKKVHRSHLVIYRNSEPADLLKPQYLYGGVPVPQQIMERVYAAERTANEAPQLAQTKRTNVWLTDMERVMANADMAVSRLNDWAYYRDNYNVKLGDKEGDEFQQFDTSLTDLDSVIMTQYQVVAAAAGVPSTKLLGTSPKGFNATGEYEEANYHEELESIQTNDLTPLLERHHMLVMRSFCAPKGIEEVETTISWAPLDSPTAKEVAETNLIKAQIGAALIASGALSSEDENRRIAIDKDSGYHDLGIIENLPDFDPEAEYGNEA